MENINKLKRSEIDKNAELKNIIFSYLSENNIELNWTSNFKQIIYHYTNDIKEIPKCYCGKYNNFKSSVVGYRKNCSPKCSNMSINKKVKIMETKLERYGDIHYNNNEKGKNTKLERYGDENYNNRLKAFETNEIRYGSYSQMKNPDVVKLGKLRKLERYGSENYNNIDKIKSFWMSVEKSYINEMVNKVKNTKLEVYGDENYNNTSKMIDTKHERYGCYYINPEKSYNSKVYSGVIKTGDVLTDWNFYKREVARYTRKNKKKLYENWNGTDHYDNELIKDYLSYNHVHRFYPTIDHKLSVFFGFANDISAEEIGHLDNLCITKRYLNSIKNKMVESEFLEKLNDIKS